MTVRDEASWEDDLSEAERALLADAVREARALYRCLEHCWPNVVALVERAQTGELVPARPLVFRERKASRGQTPA